MAVNITSYVNSQLNIFLVSYYILMYPLVLCYCGRSLGDLYDLFIAMRLEEYRKIFDTNDFEINPAIFAISEEIKVDCRPIFEALGLNKMCCRNHMATQELMKNLY